MHKRSIVYCSRKDRLGARLKNFLAAWEFADRINADLVLNWSPTAYLLGENELAKDSQTYRFLDLFDASLLYSAPYPMTFDFYDHDEFIQRPAVVISSIGNQPVEYFIGQPNSIRYDFTKRYDFGSKSSFPDLFGQLPLNAMVKSVLDILRSEISNSVSVHARRGDLVSSMSGNSNDEIYNKKKIVGFVNRYAPNSAYFNAVDTLYPGERIAIFSDDSQARAAFIHRYGARCIDVNMKIQEGLTDLQRDFVEFLLISTSKASIGNASAFVRLASEIGKIKYHSVVPYIKADTLAEDISSLVSPDVLSLILDGYKQVFKKNNMCDKTIY